MSELPRRVVTDDNRMDKGVTAMTEALAELRWHWTLDEDNPKRVPLKAYARAVGRAYMVVHAYAHGYATWSESGDLGTEIGEHIARAKVGAEKAAAIDAVAKASGKS